MVNTPALSLPLWFTKARATYLTEAFQEALRVPRSELPVFTDEETFVLHLVSLSTSPHPQVKLLGNRVHDVFLGSSLWVLVPTH